MKNYLHVLPLNDTKEHDEKIYCHCRPEIRVENEENWLVIHNAYDGREWKEMAKVYDKKERN